MQHMLLLLLIILPGKGKENMVGNYKNRDASSFPHAGEIMVKKNTYFGNISREKHPLKSIFADTYNLWI